MNLAHPSENKKKATYWIKLNLDEIYHKEKLNFPKHECVKMAADV